MLAAAHARQRRGHVPGYDIRRDAWQIKRHTGYMTQAFVLG
jgi:hypothetical protein